jgi:hypothetical protein
MGGKSVEIIFEDDGFKPEIGKQKTDKLVQQDDVSIVAGYMWSNVLLASMKTVFDEPVPDLVECRSVAGGRQAVQRELLFDLVAKRPDARWRWARC